MHGTVYLLVFLKNKLWEKKNILWVFFFFKIDHVMLLRKTDRIRIQIGAKFLDPDPNIIFMDP